MKKFVLDHLTVISKILIFVLLILIMYFLGKYFRRNDPLFEIKEVYVTSSADGIYLDENISNKWNMDIYQNNDIYINFGLRNDIIKNENPNKNIQAISIQNIKVSIPPVLGEKVDFYTISKNKETIFEYTDEYLVVDTIKYNVVDANQDVYSMEVGKQEGQLVLSAVNQHVISYIYENIEELKHDGTLLKLAGVNHSDIRFTIYFDIVLVTQSNKKYVANIEINLPYGNIIEGGFEINENAKIGRFVYIEE